MVGLSPGETIMERPRSLSRRIKVLISRRSDDRSRAALTKWRCVVLCDLDCGVGLVDVIDLSLKCNDGTYDTSPLKWGFFYN